MGGLAIVFFEFCLFLIFLIIFGTVRPKIIMCAVAGLYLAVLFGDALWGRYITIPEICKGAGVKVYKIVSPSDGLYYDVIPVDGYIKEFGLAFVEYKYGNYVNRLTVVNDEIVVERRVEPKAKYALRQRSINQKTNYPGYEISIENTDTGEVVSRYVSYGFRGGWLERFLGSFADSGPQTGVRCRQSVQFPMFETLKETFK